MTPPPPGPSPAAPEAARAADGPLPRPGDPDVTPALVAEHGLSEEEHGRIVGILGREPTFAELGVFSAMWSEHCGYKNSRPLLRTLPTEGERVVQGPGENAGVIDVGDGWGVAFKIESHNHPSAVEPYQGAATGVGGILRDVFTMGARPIALLDSLRFGSLDSPRSRYLLDGVVRGVGDYGNCVGVPTVGGETVFDPAYERNPLVNVMCVGVLPLERLVRGKAEGVGNTVMAVGARTGRDGIHGATFASDELSEESAESRPQVQVGDPFTEKLLLEASLELVERDLLVGIQDMGAAGLTSSAAEMAARSGAGIEVDVARVPVREEGMTPYEILLSESQERMLLVARPGREAEVRQVLERWELEAAAVGRVTDDGRFRILEAGRPVAEIPVEALVDGCPTYVREGAENPRVREARERDLSPWSELGTDAEVEAALRALLDAPTVASKRWIWTQYDTTVQTATLAGPGGDAALLRLPGEGERALAVAVDGNGRYVYLEPRAGARIAVAEAARNVACTGARPLAVTNCLNFGSPLRPEVYHQLSEAVAGIGEACRALGTPVTGGNVSLYNETGGTPVHPTPVIGMVGLLEDAGRRLPAAFREPGDEVLLLGRTRDELGATEYLASVGGVVAGPPPAVDLEEAARLVEFLVDAARRGLLRSAHDVSDGGLAVALAECAIGAQGGALGLEAEVPGVADGDGEPTPDRRAGARAGDDAGAAPPGPAAARPPGPAAALFGESQNRVVLSCAPGRRAEVEERARASGLAVALLGTVAGTGEPFRLRAGPRRIALDPAELRRIYESALPRRMEEEPGLTA